MQLIKKSMQKIKFFNMKWIFKDKNLQQSHHLKLLKFKYIHIYIRKVSMHFINKFFIFLSPHISFFLCDKHNIFISKFPYKSIIFLEFIKKIYDDSH